MQLDVDVDPEPLTDWFSSTFLRNHSPVDDPDQSSEEVVANLQAMDVRYYLSLPNRSLTTRIVT